PPLLEGIAETVSRLAGASADNQPAAEQALLLEALVAAVAQQAIADLVDAEVPFTIDALVEQDRIAPSATAIVDCLLRLLARFAAAEEIDAEWRLKTNHELPEISEVWRLLLAEAPDLVAELALVASAAEE